MLKKSKIAISQLKGWFSQSLGWLWDAITWALDWIFAPLQKLIGVRGMAYIFVLPNLLIFGVFSLLPVLLNFGYAFTKDPQLFLQDRPWTGGQNFSRIFSCNNYLEPNTCGEDLFWRAVYNTLQYMVLQVLLMVILSLLTALILNRKIKARGFFRSVYFYPVLLSPIVVALLWKWILQDEGLLNGILTFLGFHTLPFLVNGNWARFWIIIVSTWSNMGFFTLILLAGLQSIPYELYDAARIDGANDLQVFSGVTLPLLMPTMMLVLILSLIRAVQVFDIVYAFTGGGPGTATEYLVQYIYLNGFASPIKQLGLAATASLLMAGVLVVLTMGQLLLRREEM